MPPPPSPPQPTHILETILYVRSIPASLAFYTNTLGLHCVESTDRIAIFPIGGENVLLLFQIGATGKDVTMPEEQGVIPRHGPTKPLWPFLLDEGKVEAAQSDQGLTPGGERLRQHFCLAVPSQAEVDEWDAHLQAQGAEILGRVRWPEERGRSVYFADPDGNVGEVASRGIWDHLKG